jgi:proteic killer suppression protein
LTLVTERVSIGSAIRSFRDGVTEAIWNLKFVKSIGPDIAKQARVKLQMIDAASNINDLRVPPRNHLEQLKGNRKGQYSIRVNQQFRICFVWSDGGADDVEFCDYH